MMVHGIADNTWRLRRLTQPKEGCQASWAQEVWLPDLSTLNLAFPVACCLEHSRQNHDSAKRIGMCDLMKIQSFLQRLADLMAGLMSLMWQIDS